MKKIITLTLALLLVCSLGTAFAFTWSETEATSCTEYTLTADKYIKVDADVGSGYSKAPTATAKVGDTVYFALSAVDTTGNPVEVETEYHNIGNVEAVGKLFKGQVVGSRPYVKISITEKTPLDELMYNNEPILVQGDEVMIGDLVFIRDDKGVVRDVYHYDNTAEMLKDLNKLEINIDDVYAGKVKMTDDILIFNFGKICKTEAVVAWYVAVGGDGDEVLGIPKTGDASMVVYPVLAMAGVLALCLPRRK